ncbi:MAG: amidase [Cyclobacteriaceae bacterium]|nr:MAG: amidase [Cyclobacteriaceae bacterium]
MKSTHILFLAGIILLACEPSKEKKSEPAYQYLEEMTIPQLQVGYQTSTFTIEQVVKDYLQRIEDLDKNGPALNSIIYVNPNAIEIARTMDAELKAGKTRGLLHGIPVIVKDNMNTADMPTTAGATVLRDSYPPDDSFLVKKLRDAGAIIIAKANLSEWANFRADMSSSGWSGMLGQTKNPYVLDRNPCGSSSGSGVAASANLCAIAIGTETNGSIVCPSNANGLVGLKPTVGLLSRSGIIPISFTQDTAGPMGRTVTDVAITLGALVGVDSTDSKTLAAAGNFKADYTPHLKADGLKGKRIGLLKNISGYHAAVDTLMKKAVADLRAQGAEVVELDFNMDRSAGGSSFTVLLYEFKDGLTKYFASLGDKARVHDLAELMEFNKKDTVELKYFDQQLLKLAHEKGTLEDKAYSEALANMQKATRENGIDKLLKENNLHALMAPTGAPAWKTDLIDGDHFLGGSSSLAAISGYPSITVPMGFADVLPVGVSFFSTAWQEPVLIEIAYGYEQATKHRKAPTYIISR